MYWIGRASAVVFLAFSAVLVGQARVAGERPLTIEGGMLYTNAQSNEAFKRIAGISFTGVVKYHTKIGLQGDIHLLQFQTPQGLGERAYLAGPIYQISLKRLKPYIKAQGGFAQTLVADSKAYQAAGGYPHTPEHFAAYALGGGVDVAVSETWQLRLLEYEYQFWPGFEPHGLNPSLISFGIKYRFF